MKDGGIPVDVGRVLCRVCAAAMSRGALSTPDLVRAALETARNEIGELPRLSRCPTGRAVICPLVQRFDD